MTTAVNDNVNVPSIVEESNIMSTNVEQALAEWEAYQTFTEKLLDDSDYQLIRGKKFKKKSAWRKYSRAFNITTEIRDKVITKDDKGRVEEAEFIVRATLPNGRYVESWGSCSKLEGSKSHPNHDIPATAQTRATNRAISDLIGAGEVTAEEMQSEMRRNTFREPMPMKRKEKAIDADFTNKEESKVEVPQNFKEILKECKSLGKPCRKGVLKSIAKNGGYSNKEELLSYIDSLPNGEVE